MEHLTDEILDAYSFNPDSVTDRSAVEAHVRSCDECRRRLRRIAAFVAALRHPATWQKADGLSRRGNRSESLSAFATRLDAEEAEAERLLRPLLNASSGRFVWVDIPKQRKFCTGGAVRLLCGEAHKTCEKEPLRALSLADAATAIADALPDDLYPRRTVYDLRGVAWKERANANRYHGDLPEALNDLKRAEKAFMSGPAPALGVGIVTYIRSLVLRDQDHLDEALSDVRASEAVFRDLKLTSRYLNARLVEGMILFQARRFVAARDVFSELLASGETNNDEASIARAALNLANCDIELGNYSVATNGLDRAKRLFTQLGLTTEILRVDGSEGLLLLATGQRLEAIKRLDAVGKALADAGMILDAALVTLYALEARLPDGRSDELARIAQGLVTMFVAAGRISGALTALAYVKDLATSQQLNPSALVYVRKFLTRSEKRPELVFAPPPP